MKIKLFVGCGFALVAMMSIAADLPTNSVPTNNVMGKIESLSASIKYIPIIYQLFASCTYSVRTMAIRVKKPVLYIIFCHEKNNGTRYYDEAYADANAEQWMGTRKLKSDSVATYSKQQTEVTSSLLRRVTINNKAGHYLCDKGDKVLAVRAELWFDGNMLCNYSPQNNFALLKLGLPEDWYVKGKYPDKIKYGDGGFQ